MTAYFEQQVDGGFRDRKPGLQNADRYIGWIERALIITFVMLDYEAAIGIFVGLKAIVRYPDIKDDPRNHFAEYFFVGTATSVGLALLAGTALLRLGPLLT